MSPRRLFVGSIALLGVACDDTPLAGTDDCDPGFAMHGDHCDLDVEAVQDVVRTFPARLERINGEVFEQTMGPAMPRNVWVSRVPVEGTALLAPQLYATIRPEPGAALDQPLPVGTLILHETVDLSEGHTVQVKLEPGHVAAGPTGWWFGKFFDDGTPDEVPCAPCEMCHDLTQRPDTEGLWGVPAHAVRGGLLGDGQ